MIAAIARLVAEAWALAAALQLVLWGIQQRTRSAGIVDIGWAGSFALVVALFAWRSTSPLSAWGPIAAVVAVWSLRLAVHLAARGAAGTPEDGRYAGLRRRWAPHASRNFFIFFQAQALLTGVLSTAFVVPFIASPSHPWLCIAGAALSAAGVLGESLADLQLARWKRDPAHRGHVCDTGLWAYSRHPNYFFEWCVWLGHATYGLAFWRDGGWIAVFPQALLLASILFVTGIPPTEAQALHSKGDAYRAYQRRVSRFVPWPPRKAHDPGTGAD